MARRITFFFYLLHSSSKETMEVNRPRRWVDYGHIWWWRGGALSSTMNPAAFHLENPSRVSENNPEWVRIPPTPTKKKLEEKKRKRKKKQSNSLNPVFGLKNQPSILWSVSITVNFYKSNYAQKVWGYIRGFMWLDLTWKRQNPIIFMGRQILIVIVMLFSSSCRS